MLCALSTLWHCKEPKKDSAAKAVELVKIKPVPPVIIEMAEFGGISVSDTTDIKLLLRFIIVDNTGTVRSAEMDEAAKGFKIFMTNKRVVSHPVMEIINTDKVVLMAQGRGYGGSIWAKILLDKQRMQIEKLELDHLAESEGYGEGITYSSFESQFTDTDLNMDGSPFGLNQGEMTIVKGSHQIDGISGATQTCTTVVEMLNESLQQYRKYLKSE